MFKRILSKYLLLWLVLVCALAFYWEQLFGADVFNPFFIKDKDLRGDVMSGMIAVTMLAVGSLLPYEEVKAVAKRWYTTLEGTAIQYISMPLLAYCVASALRLEGAAFAGVMLAGCVPGAMASNVLTLTARGNVSYSVGLTTSAILTHLSTLSLKSANKPAATPASMAAPREESLSFVVVSSMFSTSARI